MTVSFLSFLKKYIVLTFMLCCVVPCVICMEENGQPEPVQEKRVRVRQRSRSELPSLPSSPLERVLVRKRSQSEQEVSLKSPHHLKRFFKASVSTEDLLAMEQSPKERKVHLRRMEADEGRTLFPQTMKPETLTALLARLKAEKEEREREQSSEPGEDK